MSEPTDHVDNKTAAQTLSRHLPTGRGGRGGSSGAPDHDRDRSSDPPAKWVRGFEQSYSKVQVVELHVQVGSGAWVLGAKWQVTGRTSVESGGAGVEEAQRLLEFDGEQLDAQGAALYCWEWARDRLHEECADRGKVLKRISVRLELHGRLDDDDERELLYEGSGHVPNVEAGGFDGMVDGGEQGPVTIAQLWRMLREERRARREMAQDLERAAIDNMKTSSAFHRKGMEMLIDQEKYLETRAEFERGTFLSEGERLEIEQRHATLRFGFEQVGKMAGPAMPKVAAAIARLVNGMSATVESRAEHGNPLRLVRECKLWGRGVTDEEVSTIMGDDAECPFEAFVSSMRAGDIGSVADLCTDEEAAPALEALAPTVRETLGGDRSDKLEELTDAIAACLR